MSYHVNIHLFKIKCHNHQGATSSIWAFICDGHRWWPLSTRLLDLLGHSQPGSGPAPPSSGHRREERQYLHAISYGEGTQYSTKGHLWPNKEPCFWAVGHHFRGRVQGQEEEERERQNGLWAGERGGSERWGWWGIGWHEWPPDHPNPGKCLGLGYDQGPDLDLYP